MNRFGGSKFLLTFGFLAASGAATALDPILDPITGDIAFFGTNTFNPVGCTASTVCSLSIGAAVSPAEVLTIPTRTGSFLDTFGTNEITVNFPNAFEWGSDGVLTAPLDDGSAPVNPGEVTWIVDNGAEVAGFLMGSGQAYDLIGGGVEIVATGILRIGTTGGIGGEYEDIFAPTSGTDRKSVV